MRPGSCQDVYKVSTVPRKARCVPAGGGRLLTPGSRPAPGGSGAGALAGHQGNGGGQGRGVRHKGTPALAKCSVVEASGDGDVVSKRRRGGTTQGSGTVIYPFETKPCKENVPGSKERMLVHRNGPWRVRKVTVRLCLCWLGKGRDAGGSPAPGSRNASPGLPRPRQ